jgi:hypothetical protein
MNSDASIAKIKMLKHSLQCFVFGLIALVPVLGLPFGVLALVASGQVRAAQRQYWNAARAYWIWGLVLGAVGILLSLLLFSFFLYRIANDGSGSDGPFGGYNGSGD